MLAMSVARGNTASEGDRHRAAGPGAPVPHTLEAAERPWPGATAARSCGGHLAVGGGSAELLKPSEHGGDTATDEPRRRATHPRAGRPTVRGGPEDGHPMGGLGTSRVHPHPRWPPQIPPIGGHRAAHRRRSPPALINRHTVHSPTSPITTILRVPRSGSTVDASAPQEHPPSGSAHRRPPAGPERGEYRFRMQHRAYRIEHRDVLDGGRHHRILTVRDAAHGLTQRLAGSGLG